MALLPQSWRHQGRRRWRGTAAAGPAQRPVRLNAEETLVGGRWRRDDFWFPWTRASSLVAGRQAGLRQRLQRYLIDPDWFPIAMAVCENERTKVSLLSRPVAVPLPEIPLNYAFEHTLRIGPRRRGLQGVGRRFVLVHGLRVQPNSLTLAGQKLWGCGGEKDVLLRGDQT